MSIVAVAVGGAGVFVGIVVFVGIGVFVGTGVFVGPNSCPGPQLENKMLANKIKTVIDSFFLFIWSPTLSRAHPTAAK